MDMNFSGWTGSVSGSVSTVTIIIDGIKVLRQNFSEKKNNFGSKRYYYTMSRC